MLRMRSLISVSAAEVVVGGTTLLSMTASMVIGDAGVRTSVRARFLFDST